MSYTITSIFDDVEIEKDGEYYIGQIKADLKVTPSTYYDPPEYESEVLSFRFTDWDGEETDKVALEDCEEWVGMKDEWDFIQNRVD